MGAIVGNAIDSLFEYEKKEITLFNKMEYTPILGSAIGAVEIIYGTLKMALEVIKGVGNYLVKNKKYNFENEFIKGSRAFARGLALNFPPIFGGLFMYQTDLNAVRKFNYNNASALLNAKDVQEKDIDMALSYTKKLPYMSAQDLFNDYKYSCSARDLSYTTSWAGKRGILLLEIQNKYRSLNLHDKADKILEAAEVLELRGKIKEEEERIKREVERQQKIKLEAQQEEDFKRKQEEAMRVAMLRTLMN